MIRLHHFPQTRSMRSLWLLHELDLDFDIVEHGFDKSLRSNAYLALHPAGRLPALEIDGQVIWESGAITEYLCERYSPENLGRKLDHPERIDWLNWVHFSETISQHSAALTQQHIALYSDDMRSPVVMKLESKRLEKCYSAIEAGLEASAGDYLLKSGFSAADISVAQAVYMAQHFAKTDAFPSLTLWYNRLSERTAFQKSLPNDASARLYQRDFYPAWEV